MAKLLIGDKVYFEVDLGCFHENEVQDALAARVRAIYPGFFFVPVSPIVRSSEDVRRPDFILIERQYRSWWVGEVEMLNHSLYGHVIPQIRTFRDGDYGDEHVRCVVRRSPEIDEKRLGILIETERPNILVVANRYKEAWSTAVQAEGAKLGIFEMFRCMDMADFVFRVNGFVPEPPGDVLTVLEVDGGVPRLLRVLRPSAIPARHGEIIHISFDGAVSDWKVMVYEDKAWLNPVGGNMLDRESKYRLRISADRVLSIEAMAEGK